MATKEPCKPSSYGPSQTALLLLDYEKAHIDMIQDAKKREQVINATKKLLKTARENNITIVHCLMDTATDPPATNKGSEKWQSLVKPMLVANPEIAAEYSEFVLPASNSTNNDRECTFHRNPGYTSALVAEGVLPLLRETLDIKHLIISGITTSGPVLGTAIHAANLDFVVTVVEEACYDPDEKAHRVVIDSVLQTFHWISSVEEAADHMSRLSMGLAIAQHMYSLTTAEE
jgi:nicotinamidase-related amidase